MVDNAEYRCDVLAANIKRFRLAKGYSQGKVAELINTSSHISVMRWENRVRVPSSISLYLLAKCLDVSIDRLFMTDEEWAEFCLKKGEQHDS